MVFFLFRNTVHKKTQLRPYYSLQPQYNKKNYNSREPPRAAFKCDDVIRVSGTNPPVSACAHVVVFLFTPNKPD